MINPILELDFGKVWFKDNILIAELNEGILFDVENNRQLLEIGKSTFHGRPYGYISHRVNSYAVNPMVYLESASTANSKAIALVTNSVVCKNNAVLEKQFYRESNSFEIFSTLDEALDWMCAQLA